MTPESTKIAAMIDGYPEDVRMRWLRALERIVYVYRASGVREIGDWKRPAGAGPNVVPLRRRA